MIRQFIWCQVHRSHNRTTRLLPFYQTFTVKYESFYEARERSDQPCLNVGIDQHDEEEEEEAHEETTMMKEETNSNSPYFFPPNNLRSSSTRQCVDGWLWYTSFSCSFSNAVYGSWCFLGALRPIHSTTRIGSRRTTIMKRDDYKCQGTSCSFLRNLGRWNPHSFIDEGEAISPAGLYHPEKRDSFWWT
jgi:hypothetical protein